MTYVTSSRPSSPFANWPIQLHDRRFGYAWYTSPAVFVCHLDVPYGDSAAAEGINDALDRVITVCDADIKAAGGLLVLQDLRSARSYSPEARQTYLARLKRRPRGYSRGVYVAIELNPFLRMAIQTANLAASMAGGGSITIVENPSEVLRLHHVEVPPNGSSFP